MVMETNLADYLTIDDNALSKINATTDVFVGKWHPLEDMDAFPSVSDVINESSEQTGVSVDSDNKQAFDEAWRKQMETIFQASGSDAAKQLDEYLSTGRSNGYKLGLQVMVLCPGKYFKVHGKFGVL